MTHECECSATMNDINVTCQVGELGQIEVGEAKESK